MLKRLWLGVGMLMAVGASSSVSAQSEVNVYSARKENLIKPLLDQFSAATGITVNLVTAKAGPLLQRLEAEEDNSPADVFITVDAGRLHQAKQAGVLQPVASPVLNAAVPAAYRDPEGYWFALSLRARPIMYVKAKVAAAELTRYEDLADPRWRGRICIRSSGNIYNQSLVASLLIASGEAATRAWLEGFVANFARNPKGGDRDQIKAAAAGQCDVAIANTYYLARMLASTKDDGQREAAQKLAIAWPNQADRGAHVNVSGAGVTRAAKNRANAVRLLEFLVVGASQQWYANVNYEYPVKSGIETNPLVLGFGDFKADAGNVAELGVYNRAAIILMDVAGWK